MAAPDNTLAVFPGELQVRVAVTPGDSEEPAMKPKLAPVSVWLVEDHQPFRQTVARVINQAAGMKCTRQFSDAEAALEILRAGEIPSVILLDVELPGQSGLEAVKSIKAASPATQIVMLTVFHDDKKVFAAICSGASGYLLKTSSSTKIIDAIRESVAGGSPMTAIVARSVLDMFNRLAQPQEKSDYGLTKREREILEFMAHGLATKEIAEKLEVSYFTADTHLRNIYTKLHVHSRGSALSKAFKENLIRPA
jgi:DNA-binding NarL/FixJ family response regulator